MDIGVGSGSDVGADNEVGVCSSMDVGCGAVVKVAIGVAEGVCSVAVGEDGIEDGMAVASGVGVGATAHAARNEISNVASRIFMAPPSTAR